MKIPLKISNQKLMSSLEKFYLSIGGNETKPTAIEDEIKRYISMKKINIEKLKEIEDGYTGSLVSYLRRNYGCDFLIEIHKICVKRGSQNIFDVDQNASHPLYYSCSGWNGIKFRHHDNIDCTCKIIDKIYSRDYNLIETVADDVEETLLSWCMDNRDEFEKLVENFKKYKVTKKEFDIKLLDYYTHQGIDDLVGILKNNLL